MEELNDLIKESVRGDSSKTYKEISAILDNNVEVNSLITWIKVNAVSRDLKAEEVLKMAKAIKESHI